MHALLAQHDSTLNSTASQTLAPANFVQVVQEALVLPLVESTIAQHQQGKGHGSVLASDQLASVCMMPLAPAHGSCTSADLTHIFSMLRS